MSDIKEKIEKALDFKNNEKFEESLEILENLHEKDPLSEEVRKSLINVLLSYGGYLNDELVLGYEKAIQLFKSVLEIEPDNYRAFYNLGIVYFNIDEIEKAIKAYKESLKLKPDYKYCLYNIGLTYEIGKEDFETALEYYDKAFEIDPKFIYVAAARRNLRSKLNLLKRMNPEEQEKIVQKICIQCGTLNRTNAKFCDNCGKEV